MKRYAPTSTHLIVRRATKPTTTEAGLIVESRSYGPYEGVIQEVGPDLADSRRFLPGVTIVYDNFRTLCEMPEFRVELVKVADVLATVREG